MAKKISLTLNYDEDLEVTLERECPGYFDYRILRESLDARGAPRGKIPRVSYDILVLTSYGENFPEDSSLLTGRVSQLGPFKERPIIIGAGPAGLFCALRLADHGIPSIIIERGDEASMRMKSIARFWRYGVFDPENNVCFGEGGAGLFSDGKLITRVKSPFVQYVMNRLVDFGAPKETAYLSNPHLGSNKIRTLITHISDHLRERGCQFHYNSRVDKILFEKQIVQGVLLANGKKIFSPSVVLATGHSSKDIYKHLADNKVAMAQKDFAVGVRVEHPRELIDKIQYGSFCGPRLGAARYRLSYENELTHKGTYSFCMCPGGYVLSSGTEEDGIVVNGMSNFARNSRWSNSALVVSVNAGKDFPSEDVLAGLHYQHQIEQLAFNFSKEFASGKELPAMNLKEFLDGKIRINYLEKQGAKLKSSSPSGTFAMDLHQILPQDIASHIASALLKFDEKLKGFVANEALLIAPETRTSSPITIMREKENLESTTHIGLYPCGEGAGYAGGITSAAVDGVKVAHALMKKEKGFSYE